MPRRIKKIKYPESVMRENTRFDAQFRPLSVTRAHSLRRRPIRIRQKYLLDGLLQVRKPEETTVRLTYHTKENFKKFSRVLGIMDDFKSGVPRTAYR